MARSSLRLGAKMPGVSTKMSCAAPSSVMPRISARVVCTLCETMVTLEPTSALSSVDLPALGAPISATKPQRVPLASPLSLSRQPSSLSAGNADAVEHGGGGGLFGGALGTARPSAGGAVGQHHRDAEFGLVMRAGARQLAIGRRRQAARLRPFLQHGLGVAQRPQRLEHALLPETLDQRVGRRIAAVDKDRAHQRLAGVRQDGGAQARRRHAIPNCRA